MKKYFLMIFTVLLMTGCANQTKLKLDDLRNTANEMKPKAEAGTIKWSDYYQIMVDKVKELPPTLNGRDKEIQEYYYGIEMAKKYESGQMSKEDFYKWRESSNASSAQRSEQFNKAKAECEYEAVSRANPNSSVEYGGNNINRKLSSSITGGYEIAMRQNEIFALCMKAKGM